MPDRSWTFINDREQILLFIKEHWFNVVYIYEVISIADESQIGSRISGNDTNSCTIIQDNIQSRELVVKCISKYMRTYMSKCVS